jgi:hypothetical protein
MIRLDESGRSAVILRTSARDVEAGDGCCGSSAVSSGENTERGLTT